LLFAIIIVLVIACAAFEIYLIFDLIDTMKTYRGVPITETLTKSWLFLKILIFISIAIGPLGYGFGTFRKFVAKEFTERINIEDSLKDYFHRRFSVLRSVNNPINRETLQHDLSRQALIFLEQILCEAIGMNHYELSVFSNKDHPEIICYFDSNKNETPRSSQERKIDPDYYKKHKYEVVDLLLSPVTKPVVISRTEDPSVQYSFVDDHQKRFIKSTLLYCFDIDSPRALVITCDRAQAFSKEDHNFTKLVAAAGLAIRGEYEIGRIIM